MADIPGVPYEPRKSPKNPRSRVTTSLGWIERGPLAPWMYRYAMWLAEHPDAVLSTPGFRGGQRGHPTVSERTAKASLEAKRRIRTRAITTLEQRPDFRAYFEKLRGDVAFLAREVARKRITKNLEARDAALDAAAGRIEMPDGTTRYIVADVKAVEQLTRPYLELAFPKKEREGEQKPTVVIHLGGKDAARALGLTAEGLLSEASDVEYEVIPNEKRLESGEEE